MTYFTFLAIFLGIPLAALGAVFWLDHKHLPLPHTWRNLPVWIALTVHVMLAVTYTTPWDNFLVATGVWYYNPSLVTGATLGWVPVEEYTFFVLQTLASGLWLIFLARRMPRRVSNREVFNSLAIRRNSSLVMGLGWFAAILLLVSGWQPGYYLSLILVWAIPPILLQLAFGADLLWQKRLPVGLALVSATLYLGAADSLALGQGIWTISPEQSLGWHILGVLPLEEMIFFLVTNVLVVFGVALVLDPESSRRWFKIRKRIFQIEGRYPRNKIVRRRKAEDPG